MNKKLNFLDILLIMMTCLSLASCSSDDNGGDDNGNENTSSINNPLVDIGKQLLVSVGETGSRLSYKYDEKLRPYYCSLEHSSGKQDDVFTIDYDKGTILVGEWEEFGDWSISFTKNGYIDRIKGSWEYTEDIHSGSIDLLCSYDNDGHLLGVDIVEEFYGDPKESGKHTRKVTLVWNNGNLDSIEQNSVWQNEDGSVSTLVWTRNFEYGDQLNTYRQYIGYLSEHGNDSPFFAAGLMGIGSERLPTSVAVVEKTSIRENKYVENATFTLNDNGSINAETWADEHGSIRDIYIYSYTPVTSYTRSAFPIESNWCSNCKTTSSMTKADHIRSLLSILPFVSKINRKVNQK